MVQTVSIASILLRVPVTLPMPIIMSGEIPQQCSDTIQNSRKHNRNSTTPGMFVFNHENRMKKKLSDKPFGQKTKHCFKNDFGCLFFTNIFSFAVKIFLKISLFQILSFGNKYSGNFFFDYYFFVKKHTHTYTPKRTDKYG